MLTLMFKFQLHYNNIVAERVLNQTSTLSLQQKRYAVPARVAPNPPPKKQEHISYLIEMGLESCTHPLHRTNFNL